MIIPIPSRNRRFSIRVGIRAYEPFSLRIKGYDPSHPFSYYFKRRVPFKSYLFKDSGSAYKEFTVPLPLSPDLLMVKLYDLDYGDDENFEIEKFEIEKMEPAEVWAEPEVHRFLDFASKFAEEAGYLTTGFFDAPDQEFLIEYLPIIRDEFGQSLVTPARTSRQTGRIQVSRAHFRNYTIPIRLFILLHERMHFQIPTRMEKPADLTALRLYLDLGFPRTEALYAASKVFRFNRSNLDQQITVGKRHVIRVKDIINFIDKYTQKKKFEESIPFIIPKKSNKSSGSEVKIPEVP